MYFFERRCNVRSFAACFAIEVCYYVAARKEHTLDQKIRLKRGTEVTVIFMGQQLRQRVWVDLETLILVCSDEEYQQALAEQRDATNLSGIRRENIVTIHP